MQSFKFTLPGNAVPKGRPRLGRGGRTYTPERTRRFEKLMREACCLYIPSNWALDGVFSVYCLFAFGDHRHRDIDNLAKCALDSMLRLAFHDDNQVHELRLLKVHGDKSPRTEVVVTRIGEGRAR